MALSNVTRVAALLGLVFFSLFTTVLLISRFIVAGLRRNRESILATDEMPCTSKCLFPERESERQKKQSRNKEFKISHRSLTLVWARKIGKQIRIPASSRLKSKLFGRCDSGPLLNRFGSFCPFRGGPKTGFTAELQSMPSK